MSPNRRLQLPSRRLSVAELLPLFSVMGIFIGEKAEINCLEPFTLFIKEAR